MLRCSTSPLCSALLNSIFPPPAVLRHTWPVLWRPWQQAARSPLTRFPARGRGGSSGAVSERPSHVPDARQAVSRTSGHSLDCHSRVEGCNRNTETRGGPGGPWGRCLERWLGRGSQIPGGGRRGGGMPPRPCHATPVHRQAAVLSQALRLGCHGDQASREGVPDCPVSWRHASEQAESKAGGGSFVRVWVGPLPPPLRKGGGQWMVGVQGDR